MVMKRRCKKLSERELRVSVKTFRHGQQVGRYIAGTLGRFLSRIRTVPYDRIDIWVSYGKREDCFGKVVEFTNEGSYTNKHDAEKAFRAFCE